VHIRVFTDWFKHNFPGQMKSEEAAGPVNDEVDAEGKPKHPMKIRYEEYKKKINLNQVRLPVFFRR